MSIDLYDVLDTYLKQERMYCMEGDSGVRKFEKLVKDMGDYGGSFGDPISEFLADNPGALTAMVEWIGEQNVQEWTQNLADCTDYVDEEDEEDE